MMSDSSTDNTTAPKKRHYAHEVFLVLVGVVMAAMCMVFLFFPRSRYSVLEKRDLAEFPDLATFEGSASDYTGAISQWFSDSEPYRDQFMAMSMGIRDFLRVSLGDDDEAVIFRPSNSTSPVDDIVPDPSGSDVAKENPLADENAKVAAKGIVIVGKGDNVMALMAFGGTGPYTQSYISLCKAYADAFPNVKVYAMVAPTSTEFYLPEKAAKCSSPQRPVLDYIRQHLPANVTYVDVYSELAKHTDEKIYLRTDHHWAPLGGHYAAKVLAAAANVPFKDLSSYERKVVHGYVGSMYGYSKDISVKNAPEDFVYYVPKGIDYKTTYITYKLNPDYQVISQSGPYEGSFFHHFKDGSGGAYCTFMGGDQHLVKVVTGTKNGRKLLITKDSFGNTLPSNLFYSFEEIHVVDFRYFKENMKDYVAKNGITDLVLFFNIYSVCTPTATEKVRRFLTQNSHDFSVTPVSKPSDSPSKTDSETVAEGKTEGNGEEKVTPAVEPTVEPTPVPETPAPETPKD